MLFENSRSALRKRYFDTWDKHLNRLPLEPLELHILEVILMHPEYQAMLSSQESAQQDFLPGAGETNPYLHMGLHLGLREQLQTDRPSGIRAIYQELCSQIGDPHAAEHRMMDCLAHVLWDAQQNQLPPNETVYLANLKKFI